MIAKRVGFRADNATYSTWPKYTAEGPHIAVIESVRPHRVVVKTVVKEYRFGLAPDSRARR